MTNLIIGFLASHGGTNMQAIIDACKNGTLNAKPGALISNNSDSGAMQRARNEAIPCYHISSKTNPDPNLCDDSIISSFMENNVNIIVLAGYMRKLSSKVIQAFNGRVLNIHPALLPKFGGDGMWGMHVHEAVIASGDKFSGPTVHLVDSEYDKGRVLAQAKVFVKPDDTPETLAARVLEKEHKLYPMVLQKIAEGVIRI